MISFFEDIHPELEEAALTDGCNIWQAFYRVAMPIEQLSWGPVATAALVVTLPSPLLTIFVQRDIVTGLAAGGIKG